MTWYGENSSGRTATWCVGDLVRYGDGPTALMRITLVRQMPVDHRGISCSVRYYGRAFHSSSTCTGRYHGQCHEPTEADLQRWRDTHDIDDAWIRGKF